ncbi:hypothetical protein [Mycobacterium riyadhense]|uniref:Secretion protein n=1 Tax=Mycobacterium riyadhense TaxID=486698 RepID=A0A1X2B9F7_9MYCO|nr:hypothetical protein [Mycobacterium riyadhense]MCV7146983.1 hypothetical protein [Mycobacterium riyadhense]ORW60227.1 hypothetical protein AWC22_05790 [Mycobacterium riyadhense]VTP00969.1 hypothetical protein BIN_B_03831 [Mycobacterium riyadhense]
MSGVIHGELDGIARDAQGLQEVSDTQASIMHSLAAAMESLAPAMQGSAGTMMQNVGEQLHQQGMRFSTTFADHSHMMGNNGQIFQSHDDDSTNIISQVAGLIS